MGPLGIDLRVLSQNKKIRPEEFAFFRPDALRQKWDRFSLATGSGS
jgi:hypothetical protein